MEGKPGFTISAVSRRYGIHPQTLRSYEREGLLKPSRSEGNTRLYEEKDLERLETILTLTRELGVNLAGVQVVLNMREKMKRLQAEIDRLVDFLRTRIDEEPELFEDRFETALVPFAPHHLVHQRKQKDSK